MAFYAQVIVNNESINLDKPFTYKIPENVEDKIRKGFMVKVPFGRGNKKIDGFCIDIIFEYEGDDSKLKYIFDVYDEKYALTLNDLNLINFMRAKYLCKYIEAIRLLIPPKIMHGNKSKVKNVLCFKKEVDGKFLKENYKNIIDIIRAKDGIFTKTEIINKFNVSIYSLNKLIKNDYVELKEVIVDRANYNEYEKYEKIELNEEQKNAVDTVLKSSRNIFLLKGVTGSGKTEVYMALAENMKDRDKSTLILVPEISLTPQMIQRFKGRFGKNVGIFHSKLSDGERFDEWLRVKNSKSKIIIGARSAIFLPFSDLGLIVIDEEHENTYKSEQNPKYDTREIAKFKSEITNCKIVLGSATPSIESYYKAKINEYTLIEIKNRATKLKLPKIEIVDMRDELKAGNKSMLSRRLYSLMKDRLLKKEQGILFLNRRGYSTFVSCRKCGYVFKCDNCDIAMTYHKSGFLICHYCGKRQKQPNTCPKCNSNYVKFFGAGTEKIENIVKEIFVHAKVIRMDVDTTRKKDSLQKLYNSFKNGEGDILVGTQMISKGLDFKNVTVVGIVACDISLNIPDYRSSERTFQIVTQVSGRAGRGEKEGISIVQTYNPLHYSLNFAVKNDYEGFYNEEIKIRKSMGYPPFAKIFLINLSSKYEDKLIKFANTLGYNIKNKLRRRDLDVLGPCPCIIGKINEMFRWQIIIKGEFDDILAMKIKEYLYESSNDVYNIIRISIDINPNSLV